MSDQREDPPYSLTAVPTRRFLDWLSRDASVDEPLDVTPASALQSRRELLDDASYLEEDAFSLAFSPDARALAVEQFRTLNALGVQVAWTIEWDRQKGYRLFRSLLPDARYSSGSAMADQLRRRLPLPLLWRRAPEAFASRQRFCRDNRLANHVLLTGQLVHRAADEGGDRQPLGVDAMFEALSLVDEPFSITLIADPVPPESLSGALDFLLAATTACLQGADVTITTSRAVTAQDGKSELDPRYRVHRAIVGGVQGALRTLGQAAGMFGAAGGSAIPPLLVASGVLGMAGGVDLADLFGWSAQIQTSRAVTDSTQSSQRIVDERRTFYANKLRELTELFDDGGQHGLWAWFGAVSAPSRSVARGVADVLAARLSANANSLEQLRTRDVVPQEAEAIETAIDHLLMPRMRNPSGILGRCYGSIAQSNAMPFLFATPTRSHRGVRAIRMLPSSWTRSSSAESLQVGVRPDRREDVRIDFEELCGHVLVCGRTGSGKTTVVRHLLRQASVLEDSIPFVFIDMAQSITRSHWDFVPNALMYEGSRDDLGERFPSIGLFDFGRPDEYDHYVWQLADLLTNWLPSEGPIALLLAELLHSAYRKVCSDEGHFWLSGEPDAPRIGSLEAHIDDVFRDASGGRYEGELRSNLAGALVTRLRRLNTNTLRAILDGTSTSFFDALRNRRSLVLSLARSGSTNERCFLALSILIKVRQWLRETRDLVRRGRPRMMIVLDEAHVLLRKAAERDRGGDSNVHAYAVRWFDELVAEIRQLGASVIVVDQSPSLLAESVLFGTSNKIVFPLASGTDMQTVAAALPIPLERADALGALPNLMAYVRTANTHDLSLMRVHERGGT